ncbi:MAG TPA: 30S ribosomal protein S8 [Candidatus Paceibacterota bacterium]|nr:30S ribosomal protein S8 [Candidatus Paceibacterota bacterium]
MYYRILPELKNAVLARKDRVTFPFSKMDLAVLTALKDAGYVKSAEKEMAGRKSVIAVRLPSREKALNDFRIVSKPSRHFYADYRSIRKVKQGHGLGVFSTSHGIKTDRQALKEKIGGEYLFEVW